MSGTIYTNKYLYDLFYYVKACQREMLLNNTVKSNHPLNFQIIYTHLRKMHNLDFIATAMNLDHVGHSCKQFLDVSHKCQQHRTMTTSENSHTHGSSQSSSFPFSSSLSPSSFFSCLSKSRWKLLLRHPLLQVQVVSFPNRNVLCFTPLSLSWLLCLVCSWCYRRPCALSKASSRLRRTEDDM